LGLGVSILGAAEAFLSPLPILHGEMRPKEPVSTTEQFFVIILIQKERLDGLIALFAFQ